MSGLRIFTQRLEAAEIWMLLEANQSHHPQDFKVGDSVYINTILLPIGYAYHTKLQSVNLKCRQCQHHFGSSVHITEAICANSFRLNTPAHWQMPNDVTVSQQKKDLVDYGREHPPPLSLHMMTDIVPEYDGEAILEHLGTAAKTLRCRIHWLRYLEPHLPLLGNSKGSCRDLLQHYHHEQGLLVCRWMLEG